MQYINLLYKIITFDAVDCRVINKMLIYTFLFEFVCRATPIFSPSSQNGVKWLGRISETVCHCNDHYVGSFHSGIFFIFSFKFSSADV